MRLLTVFLLLGLTLSLTVGCGQKIEVEDRALFCDVEEPRRFSQEELDWRADNAPWNLRRDFKTNTTWERECLPLTEGKDNGE